LATNARTSRKWKVHYNYNYGSKGTWTARTREGRCDFKLVEGDHPDFQKGDKLTYGERSSFEVVETNWTWSGETKELYVINNTLVNECGMGVGQYVIRAHIDTSLAKAQNNLIIDLNSQEELKIDASRLVKEKPVIQASNFWTTKDPGLFDIRNFDYSLTNSARMAIDKGTQPGGANGYPLAPRYHYRQDLVPEARRKIGVIDIGAYEYQ
jgi:hypothetical protein